MVKKKTLQAAAYNRINTVPNQSRRRGEIRRAYSLANNLQDTQIETWNPVNQWSFVNLIC